MKNILIGLFVAAAIILAISMILFLNPKIGDGKKTLSVRFANIAGISIGTRVTFAGRPIGEVIAIQEIREARSMIPDDTGRVYFYQLTLKIDSSIDVYNSDEVAIRTTGLMGEKSIAILPKAAPQGKTATLVTDQVLTASSIDPLENTFNHITKASSRLESSIARIDQWFTKNQDGLSQSIQGINTFFNQGAGLLSTLFDPDLISSIQNGARLLTDNLDLIKSSLADEQLLSRYARLAASLQDAADAFNSDGALTLRNLNQVSHDLAHQTGTIGKLISGEDLYLRMSSLMSKGETLMNDINHYGLLFQYDKQWKKSRTRRSNILKSLDTAKEFRTYFEGEVDAIQTSLARLTELLELAGDEKKKIVEDETFKRQFGTLLRTTQGLSDTLRLYNEELIADTSLND